MNFTKNAKGISKLLLVLLLLMATIVGAILSYLWAMGYYLSLEQVFPEGITVNITDSVFDPQHTYFFNTTIQNPTSYESEEPANITQIIVSTEDGVLHTEIDTSPPLPHKFQHKGELETFNCFWNWANYTGETVRIIALVADGSGSAFEVETPPVELMITAGLFYPSDTTHFNVTLYLSEDSPISVNFTRMAVTMENGTTLEITEIAPSLPHLLSPNSYTAFRCSWDWTNLRGENATITVYTSQGYTASRLEHTSEPVILSIPSILFNPANTTYFNATVMNSEYSITQANVTLITVTLQNGTSLEVTVEPSPSLPYSLSPDNTVTFKCLWDWTNHRGENVIITVETLKGYMSTRPEMVP